MRTNITNGDKTYWVGMTETQLGILRHSVNAMLLANSAEITFLVALHRTRQGIDNALVWETIEALEKGLETLAQSP